LSLKTAIGQLSAPTKSIQLTRPRIAAVVKELAERMGEVARSPLAELDADALRAAFQAAIRSGRWDMLSDRQWRQIPWIAFDEPEPLANQPAFLDVLLTRFGVRKRRAECKTLATVYLKDFSPENNSIARLAKQISDCVDLWDWPWRDRHRRFALFDPQQGPKKVADFVLASDLMPSILLESVGLVGMLADSGFAGSTYICGVGEVGRQLFSAAPRQGLVARLLAWSSVDGKLVYPQHRGPLADALLRPWVGGRSPSDDLRTEIVRFILAHFKDPRTMPGNWVLVSEDARSVMRRWLTHAALEQFVEVIDHFAVEHMWRYRRAFWMAYFEKGVIADAKVLFGPNAKNYARAHFEAGQSFGSLDRGGIDADHSVLLLRIGNLTIADWSHNGKCHIWLEGNRRAPALWPNPPKLAYSRDELRSGSNNNGVSHMVSETGNWQSKIAEYIYQNTNIRLTARDYMPRR
jgi:hypothetical protein